MISKTTPSENLGFGQVVKAAGITGVSSVIGEAAGYLMVFLLTLTLGAGGFGLFSLVLTVKSIATLVGSLSLGITVLRFGAKYRSNQDSQSVQTLIRWAVMVVLIWSTIVAGTLWLLAPFLAGHVFRKPELTLALRIAIWAIPLEAIFNILVSGLHGLGFTAKRAYLEQLILPVGRLLLVAMSLLVARSVEFSLGAMVAASGISVVMAGVWLARECRFWEAPLLAMPADVKDWVKYTIPAFLDALLVTSLGGSVEVLLLGIFGTEELVGIYSVVLRLKFIVNMPMTAFNNALAPLISKFHACGDRASLKSLFRSATRWVMMVGLPLAAACVLFGDFLLGLFGDAFAAGHTALILVMLGQLVNIAVGPVGHMLLMAGYSRVRLINSLVLLTEQLVLGLWLIPNRPLIGAGIVAAVSVATISILGIVEVFFLLRIHPYRLDLAKPWLACIFAMGIVGVTRGLSGITDVWFSAILLLGFSICYLGGLFGLGLNGGDKSIFLQAAHRLRLKSSSN